MSKMTEMQRRRAEENRLRALERRAQSQKSLPAMITAVTPAVTPAFTPAVPQAQARPVPSGFSSQSRFNSWENNGKTNAHPKNGYAPLWRNKNGAAASSSATSSGATYSGPVATGTCRLITRDRFVADMGYHAEVVKMFKNIPGSKYDPITRKWSFDISEHSAVISAVDSVKPQAAIAPLPSHVIRIFRNAPAVVKINDCDWEKIDPVLGHQLLPFQREGVNFGISRGGRVLIADDMGLGKTIQALGIAHFYYSEWPLMIVTPSSLRYTWREAIWNWLPSVPGGSIVVVESKQDYICDAKVLIISYDLLQRRADEPPIQNCKVIIVDESHLLKNFKTARTKAMLPLLQKCRRAILLSGTPALSRPMELYTQISAINRNLIPAVNDYMVRYCAGKKTAWGYDSKGASNMEELQLFLKETMMIRRLKSEVLSQLPAKTRKLVVLDPALVRIKSNKVLLTTAATFAKDSKSHGKLLEYFGETGKAKVDAVVNYIKDLVESGEKFICFAHHRAVLDGINQFLDQAKIRYIRIDGSMPSEERKRVCDLFQHSEECLVALLSLTAANTGLTMTSANLVVFAELYWNPGELIQAEDRVHRIGQEKSVSIQYLVARGTADDALWAKILEKIDVLSKAGLSTENFRDTTREPVAQPSKSIAPASQSKTQEMPSQKQTAIDDFFRPSLQSTQFSKPSSSSIMGDTITNEDLELAAMLDSIPSDEFSKDMSEGEFGGDDDDGFPVEDFTLFNDVSDDDDIFAADDSLEAALMNQTLPGDDDDECTASLTPPKKSRMKC